MTCKDGNHSLIEILVSGHWDHSQSAKWCKECGAVVVDVEVDGRVQPGRYMPMKFPKRTA